MACYMKRSDHRTGAAWPAFNLGAIRKARGMVGQRKMFMDIEEVFEEVARGALGFVELASTDEVDDGVGGSVEFVGGVLDISHGGDSQHG
jgi:hypothetical protein